jgi:hypothetical protein
MKPSLAVAALAIISAFAATVAPAMADGRWHRGGIASPRLYAKRAGGIRYYNACPYGDCACLRSRALASGSQVWWDRYQACTG